jgi:hypothetical protein
VFCFWFFVFFQQRPTARELLKHKFIKGSKKPSVLIDLIQSRHVEKDLSDQDE